MSWGLRKNVDPRWRNREVLFWTIKSLHCACSVNFSDHTKEYKEARLVHNSERDCQERNRDEHQTRFDLRRPSWRNDCRIDVQFQLNKTSPEKWFSFTENIKMAYWCNRVIDTYYGRHTHTKRTFFSAILPLTFYPI